MSDSLMRLTIACCWANCLWLVWCGVAMRVLVFSLRIFPIFWLVSHEVFFFFKTQANTNNKQLS